MATFDILLGSLSSVGLIRTNEQLFKAFNKTIAGLYGAGPLASVDPAGLIISEKLRTQIGSLEQELSNINGVILKYDYADANLGQLGRILTEIRTDAIAAANTATLDPASQEAIQNGVDQLVETFNQIRNQAEFIGAPLLDGGERAVADISELEHIDVSSAQAVEAALEQIDAAAAQVNAARGDLGARIRHDLGSAKSSMEVTIQNLMEARAARGEDFMKAFMEFIQYLRNLEIGIAVNAHAGLSQSRIFDLLKHSARYEAVQLLAPN